ncbi:MAG: SURF1 family protein, partial [Chloroflexi bacterium]
MPDDLHRRRVTVTGTFDNAESVILQNRPFQGRAGVELLTPLRISGSKTAVLVD